MQLSRLEIKGFKSFGDKVVIHFDEGITGVVGPNGCGKSNIVDAIRWVLGEQSSRTLRSEKMENVIFNGTRQRKSTQLAEVSLTFNNTKNLLPTAYSQITITRRYYRSGESEYLLNGVTCRLKDITNLFLDTGIASNSYAIIELKMVDDLLNDKDNSRRGLFEEAAGISKFKKRKKETLKTLTETDADLERVEDLLYEIEKNMRALERQAKQTERYYQLKEEYKRGSLALAGVLLERLSALHRSLTAHLEQEEDKKVALTREGKDIEANLASEKAELLVKEKALSSAQKALNAHVADIRQYESEKKIKNERLRFLNDKSESLRGQLQQDRKSNERAAFSIGGLLQEKDKAVELLEKAADERALLQEDYKNQQSVTKRLREEEEALRRQARSKRDEVFQLHKAIEIKELQLESLKEELKKTASDSDEQSTSLVAFDHKLTLLEEELAAKSEELSAQKNKRTELESRTEHVEGEIAAIKEVLFQTNRKLDAKQNEYNLTKSLVENLEGFPEAIKFLKKKTHWNKSAPLLSDILTCDREYRVAIENYLEPYLNYYIVDKEADAYQAVDLLSEAARGRAHFFILEALERFVPSEVAVYDNAFPATEIMEYDDRYERLMACIMDGVYVCSDSYPDIPPNDDHIFITRDGKVTKRRFSITGGSVGIFEGKRIGRAKNLEKLEREIKRLSPERNEAEQHLSEKKKELEQLRSNSLKRDIERLQAGFNRVNEECIALRSKREQFARMVSDARMRKEDMTVKIVELTHAISESRPAAEEKAKELQETEERLADIAAKLREETDLLSEKSSAYNAQNILFHQKENRVKSIEQEVTYKQDSLNSSKMRIAKNEHDLGATEAEIKKLIAKNEANDDRLVALYEEREGMEHAVNRVEKEYYTVRGNIDDLDKRGREVQRRCAGVDTVMAEVQNKLYETTLNISNLKERLQVEFDIVPDEVAGEEGFFEDEVADEEVLRGRVKQAKDKMERMGPINPMAMEAYHEIKERHHFINGERDDLLKAKESLLTTIGEIDEVAKTTFLEAYDKIKSNFIKVFRSLFTEEDDCDLRLSDPESPLESRIEIIAKPKGKKPLTINQLSGGEKTLTATSLLFAIYLIKPAPFCIFDEVDAPLDDANIDKFNRIIKTFSKDSQFIIVTHNKRTMTSTDIIYGITMVEQGVSRVVPVDLRELADEF